MYNLIGDCMNVREELFKNQDIKYGEFHSKLVPNCDREKVIGVRLPTIRKIAKKAAKENAETQSEYYEEKMIKGLLIAYKKMSFDERLVELEKFVPLIDNWAICDCCSSTYKFANENLDEIWKFIIKYKNSTEYEVRFMIVMMLDYFLIDEYIDRVIDILSSINREEYYINMAIAWTLATAYVNYREKILSLLENNILPIWVHNKTIQKCIESYRVTDEDKSYLKTLKIKKK